MTRGGLCTTCAAISTEGVAVDSRALAWEEHPQASAIAPHYRWLRSSNRRYDIYIGEGAMMSVAVVVVEQKADGPRIVWVRRLSALERLREMLGV